MEPSPTSDLAVLTTIIRKEMHGVHSRVELRVLEWFKVYQEREDKKWAEVVEQAADALLVSNRTVTRLMRERDEARQANIDYLREVRRLQQNRNANASPEYLKKLRELDG